MAATIVLVAATGHKRQRHEAMPPRAPRVAKAPDERVPAPIQSTVRDTLRLPMSSQGFETCESIGRPLGTSPGIVATASSTGTLEISVAATPRTSPP